MNFRHSEPREVYYGGVVKGASAMKLEDEIGPVVTHTYEVINAGPLRISKFIVYIDWPYEVASDRDHGKYALYMMSNPYVCSVIRIPFQNNDNVYKFVHSFIRTGRRERRMFRR